jgi:hypothetical protein
LINDPSRVFIARHGLHELTNLVLTSAQVQELVERMLKWADAEVERTPHRPQPAVRRRTLMSTISRAP